jgi:hypothetical protein
MEKQTKIILGVVGGLAVIGGIWYFGFRKPKPTTKDKTIPKDGTPSTEPDVNKLVSEYIGLKAVRTNKDKAKRLKKEIFNLGYVIVDGKAEKYVPMKQDEANKIAERLEVLKAPEGKAEANKIHRTLDLSGYTAIGIEGKFQAVFQYK